MTYNEFIQNIINTRGQWNTELKKCYCERHHIIPRSKGGLPKTLTWQPHENIIWLTAYEHFIAHKLLAEENPNDYSIVSAWVMMAFPKGATKRDFEITAEEYAELRLLNHSIKVGKCFVSKEKQLAVGQLNKEYAAKRTLEEKELIANKKIATFHTNYTDEEIIQMYKERGQRAREKSSEEKARRKEKYLKTWANKTKAELEAHKLASSRPGKLNGAYGKHWYNNGIYRIFTDKCPEGFVPGMGHKLISWKEKNNV